MGIRLDIPRGNVTAVRQYAANNGCDVVPGAGCCHVLQTKAADGEAHERRVHADMARIGLVTPWSPVLAGSRDMARRISVRLQGTGVAVMDLRKCPSPPDGEWEAMVSIDNQAMWYRRADIARAARDAALTSEQRATWSRVLSESDRAYRDLTQG